MTELLSKERQGWRDTDRKVVADRVSTGGWALFFIWAGIAWLTEINLGVALLGVAAIILGGQLVRAVFKLSIEGFWVVAGLCFAVGGIAQFAPVDLPILPALMILGGAALLFSLFRPKRRGGSA